MNDRLGVVPPAAACDSPSDATTIDGQHYDPRANEWHLLSEGGRAGGQFSHLKPSTFPKSCYLPSSGAV